MTNHAHVNEGHSGEVGMAKCPPHRWLCQLAWQTLASGIIMYLVMFVMIDRLSSFYNNSICST